MNFNGSTVLNVVIALAIYDKFVKAALNKATAK